VLDGHEEFDVRGDASAAHIDQIHELGGHHLTEVGTVVARNYAEYPAAPWERLSLSRHVLVSCQTPPKLRLAKGVSLIP